MSIKTIPEKMETTCDICQVLCDNLNSKHCGALYIKRHILDDLGVPCAKGDVNFDLCDNCLNTICDTINKKAGEIRIKPK